ncbi:MAG: AMP-binding protein [Acidobacteriota bacterium]
MRQSSFQSSEELDRQQLAKLQAMLTAVNPANRFYVKKLEQAGFTGEVRTVNEFCRRMPFTSKRELVADQQSHPPYGSNLTYPLDRYKRLSQTSATSGSPLRWLDTEDSWNWMLACWRRIFRMSGVRPADSVFFAFSFAPFLGFWTAFEAAVSLGCLSIPGGGLSSAARLAMILENGVTVLCCTPTYALRLAEVAGEENIDLAKGQVRKIIVAGEPGGSIPSVRARLENSWPGAQVLDHHGMTESGPVTYQCPESSDCLHILESDYIAEVVDPQSGEPAQEGQTGELVLTNLGRWGSPILRYRTGDLVRVLPRQVCRCGSQELALQGGILGRTDDTLFVRGVNLYPSAVEEILRGFEGISEYCVEVDTQRVLPELRIQIEVSAACANPSALAEMLQKRLAKAFTLRIPVLLVPAGTLPRFEMKARRWVRRS